MDGRTLYFFWEVRLMEWLQGHLGPAASACVSFLSVFGEEMIMIAILGFLYWGWNKKMARSVGLSVLMGVVWNPMIKNVVLRRRPYFDHSGIRILRVVEPEADIYDIAAQGYSFPSGHSTNAVAIYGSLALQARKRILTAAAVILPLLVGISRVAVGAHYPTDVLAGWLLGGLIIAAVHFLQEKIDDPAVLNGILLATSLPGILWCRSADYFTGLGLLLGFLSGSWFEEKFVRFENVRTPVRILLRMAGGIGIYFILNTVLKLPFSREFLEGAGLLPLLVRTLRYTIITFVDFAIYPMLFRAGEK